MSHYKHHVFFCTNKRDNGRKCCSDGNAEGMLAYAKKRAKELSLNGPGKARVNASGCMERCALGPTIAVYPEGVWYTYRNEKDVEEILTEHVVNGRIVERLRLVDGAILPEESPVSP
jgi:(2Fe-2S) ferredoxin